MHGLHSQDGPREIDWGKTLGDSSDFRPGPPMSFYERLPAFGIGLKGQSILDLGTGTGVLARQFARQKAAHDELLRKIAPETFTVLHRIDAFVFEIQ